jgi:hypothetical protein
MLPSDRYLADLLGMSEEDYEFWKDKVRKLSAEGPRPAVVCGEPLSTSAIVSIVLSVISIGFQLISLLLMPKARTPGKLAIGNETGQSQNTLSSFAPRVGFSSTQSVAALGEPIPVVYAHRETIAGITYGGIRVNTSLLWSQIISLGGSQMLRAVFMLAEGPVASIDLNGFAIGDSSLSVYDLGSAQANEIGGRLTIYYRPNGGRIVAGDRILGRAASTDPGNAMRAGAADVFQVASINNALRPDFCSTAKPATSTTFGVYTLIGNDLGFKLNPLVRPQTQAAEVPSGKKGDRRVVCNIQNTVVVERAKYAAFFSTRSGITAGTFNEVGGTVTYRLLPSSDFETIFTHSEASETWGSSKSFFGFEFQKNVNPFDFTFSPSELQGITEGDVMPSLAVSAPIVGLEDNTVSVNADVNIGTITNLYENADPDSYLVQWLVIVESDSEDVIFETKVIASVVVASGTAPRAVTVAISGDPEFPAAEVLTSPDRLRAVLTFEYEEMAVYSESADDAASSIANRQTVWDDAIVVGDLYKIGSALAVCTARSPSNEVFRSEADLGTTGSGQGIDATFRIVRAGSAATTTAANLEVAGTTYTARKTATSGPHIMRVAIASGTTEKECRVIQFGYRSSLGIRYSGLLRFRTTLTYADADGRACLNKEGNIIKSGNTLKLDNYQSGQVSGSEERYSFYRVFYKKQSETTFTPLAQIFGFVGIEQQSMFNYLTLEFPSQDAWDWMKEPLCGWEIRNVVTDATLYVVDSRLSDVITVNTTTGGRTVKARFNGRTVTRNQATFKLQQTDRESIGTPHPDTDNNYADAWGKLAEAFIYEEITSSATQPEHEIVYINEIIENQTAPLYDGIALIGVNVASAFEWQQFSQLSPYVTGGTEVRRLLSNMTAGPSHLLPDLGLDRLTNPKYGPENISDDMVKIDNFRASAQWCYDRRYFFDGGVIISQEPPRQWIADHAGFMLLDFREVNGQFDLVPFITFEPVKHVALFTAGNIAKRTFKFETIPLEDREPSQISVRWRQERSSINPANPGMFPQVKEVLVREAAPYGDETLPIEPIEMDKFCTNENHAIDVAKFTLRLRRLRDHAISFETTYDGLEGITTGIGPGDMIRVAMDATSYSEFNNGVVLKNGTVVSTQSLGDGSYDVVSWNGTGDVDDSGLLTITGGIGAPAGIIFTVKRTTTETRSYQILKITPTDDGAYSIEAVHMPTNASGFMLAVLDWDEAAAWVIQR